MTSFNEYALELYAREILTDARAVAAREALVRRAPVVRPALTALAARVRARYARWSSAASAGSKPTTLRAWSRSR